MVNPYVQLDLMRPPPCLRCLNIALYTVKSFTLEHYAELYGSGIQTARAALEHHW